MLDLKNYQQATLDSLRLFFRNCLRFGDAETAFVATTRETVGRSLPYNPVPDLAGLPYVCIRIPTGGGKTLVASHAVGVALRDFVRAEHGTVLWLVPSETIREQTLRALRDGKHPYRTALERDAGPVDVMDVAEALQASRGRYEAATVVIVATMQAFRREETAILNVYKQSGSLLSHFDGFEIADPTGFDAYEDGKPVPSLANVLRLRRPIIIVDEAHNSRTPLSFTTLDRFRPACILEFTATPSVESKDDSPPSNVLHTVSAAELAAEDMIKMPIRLVARGNWRELVADAVRMRNALEATAGKERLETGEYIRPVLLLQAQPERKGESTIGVEELRGCLLTDCKVAEKEILRATGKADELKDLDLFDPESPVRYLITIQKLREGWDCSFAYVLCTVAESRSKTAVEQIIGRLMRLPRAARKKREELNRAYVFAMSERFEKAAGAITDALIENGFERQTAAEMVVQAEAEQGDLFGGEGLFAPEPVAVKVGAFPPMERFSKATQDAVRYDAASGTLEALTPLSGLVVAEIESRVNDLPTQERVRDLAFRSQKMGRPARSPAEEGRVFRVPWLAVRQGDLLEELEVFEETHLTENPLEVRHRDPVLDEEEFPSVPHFGEAGEIRLEEGQLRRIYMEGLHAEMIRLSGGRVKSEAELVLWLDRSIRHPDITPDDMGVFLLNVVRHLTRGRGMTLEFLTREMYRLRDAVEGKLRHHRLAARREAFQTLLLQKCETPLVVKPELCFEAGAENTYAYRTRYNGPNCFKKHFYQVIGDLDAKGEQFDCAVYLDQISEVDCWIRNIERNQERSFWFQTSTDKFYPDFLAKLKDGRYLVLEHKGEDRYDTPDSQEKRHIGEIWQERSEGKCVFVMTRGRNFEQIQKAVRRREAGFQDLLT